MAKDEYLEIRRTCAHCDGKGYTPRVHEHSVALDLLVDAEDVVNFDDGEARRLYLLAAKYEEGAAQREHSLMPMPMPPTVINAHLDNARYLRSVAEAEHLPKLVRHVVTSKFVVTGGPTRMSVHDNLKLVPDADLQAPATTTAPAAENDDAPGKGE